MTYLGLEDSVLLPKMVHDSKDAQGPCEAQQVGQDPESAAEDQASPKGVAECPPDGPGTLRTMRVFLLPRETHVQVREGPDIPGSPRLLLPGETQVPCLLRTGKLQEKMEPLGWVGPIRVNMIQIGKLRPEDRSSHRAAQGPCDGHGMLMREWHMPHSFVTACCHNCLSVSPLFWDRGSKGALGRESDQLCHLPAVGLL